MNDSREHILNTSFKLFLQKNFKEVTMKEIVAQTGLSKGAFYHYFSSKEQVFEEVIEHFFMDFMQQDFSKYSHDSLREFCDDYLKDMETKIKSAKKIGDNQEESFTANHYFLLFDAFKMLPNFKEKHQQQDLEEIKNWEEVIALSKIKGEIKSLMPDEEIAKLFIYLSDGFGIRLIMNGNIEQIDVHGKELQTLWRGLYNMLKA